MSLPAITVPFATSDLFPLLLHPVVVHFAVVLPLVILILELVNLITKRKALSITVYLLFALLVAVFLAAYATGLTDGKEAGPFLSSEGADELKSHSTLGTYLVYLSLLPLVLKVLSLFVKKGWSRALYSAGLLLFTVLTFWQAEKGGELVFTYGANVSSQQVAEERILQFEKALASFRNENNESNESNRTLSQSGVVPDANCSEAGPADLNLTAPTAKPDVNSSKKDDNSSR